MTPTLVISKSSRGSSGSFIGIGRQQTTDPIFGRANLQNFGEVWKLIGKGVIKVVIFGGDYPCTAVYRDSSGV
jgi:hypothetical protein